MGDSKQVYRLQNLSCTNCAAKFEKNIRGIRTVEDVQLNFGAAKVTVFGEVSIEQIEKAGAFDGIKVYPERQKLEDVKEPFWKNKENMTTLLSLFILVFGFICSYQIGVKSPITSGLYALAIVTGGYSLFIEGFKNLLKLHFDMATLMSIAIVGATILGEWSEGAVVVFLFALSESLERYSMDQARQSIRSLMAITPKWARIKRGNQVFEVEVDDIQIGDRMMIRPGEKIAMDGEVIEGQSSVNQASITGESSPVYKEIGNEVFAGTLNEEGSLTVRVTKRVEDTTMAKIIHLVEEAQAEKAPSQAFVDRFAKYYTPAILVIAFLVAIVPPLFFAAEWSKWVYQGLAVLVVGCPCALVISTPVAIVTAIGNAARKGVLIKGGIHLEETGRLKVIAFDKTGTLTEGKPQVTNVLTCSDHSEEEIIHLAAMIESFSQHPLASAIIRASKKSSEKNTVKDFQSITGKGAKATINETVYWIGNPELFIEKFMISDEILSRINDFQQDGKTVVLLGTATEIHGLIIVEDQIRPNSASIIKKLYQLGIQKTILLTGDNLFAAESIGKQVGISEVKANLMPEEKWKEIKQLREEFGHTAMVGDGINDAPALAAATVGVAMGGAGTDTALETADIALMGDDLEKLPYTIALSRKTILIIKQNITFALGLKLIALLLVIPGWLTLWIAIFADMGATLIVVLNSMRLMKQK
jgi:Cd2+/Zn2+-exporting ATPase